MLMTRFLSALLLITVAYIVALLLLPPDDAPFPVPMATARD